MSRFIDALEAGLSEHVDTVLLDDFCGCDACYWRLITDYVVPRVIAAHDRGEI